MRALAVCLSALALLGATACLAKPTASPTASPTATAQIGDYGSGSSEDSYEVAGFGYEVIARSDEDEGYYGGAVYRNPAAPLQPEVPAVPLQLVVSAPPQPEVQAPLQPEVPAPLQPAVSASPQPEAPAPLQARIATPRVSTVNTAQKTASAAPAATGQWWDDIPI